MALNKGKRKKGKRKKTKFSKIVFRIPQSRKKQLDRYCLANNTTPRIALRRIINSYLDANTPLNTEVKTPKNQLTLFNLQEFDKGGIQTTMDLL